MVRKTRKRAAKAKTTSIKAAAPAKPPRAKRTALPATTEHEPIELKDQQVEEALKTGEHSGLLEDYFGAAQYAELRTLAQEAATRSVRGADRVLILPGIMGSKLGYARGGLFDDVVWANPLAIGIGRLAELKLPAGKNVRPVGTFLFTYLKLKLRLQISGHDADFFPYDWRQSIPALGKSLAAEIKGNGRKVHLVAHSMGGLVARAALLNNPQHLGRIIMLGTPNFGSFAPIQAFRGADSMVRKVAFIDLRHSAAELAGIFGTFPGLCEMIPSPQKFSTDFFKLSSWPKGGVRPAQAILTDALKNQTLLPTDYDDLFVIAGIDQQTVVGARIDGDEFLYTSSSAGDGTVPLQSARLPSAKQTYYVAESHGSLPNNERVRRAVESILARGETTSLPNVYEPSSRGDITGQIKESQIRRPPFDGNRGRALSAREKRYLISEVAAPAEEATAPIEAMTMLPSAMADDRIANSVVVGRQQQHRLDVTLAYGSITEVAADAYVLGLFSLVPPSGAASAIDEKMDGAIRQMFARRMFNANVGEISILPIGKHPLRADVVAFAGLGPFDKFKDDVLEIVGENLVRTFVNSRIDDFATVPIGGSTDGFSPVALTKLLTGFFRGLKDADHHHHFRGITICETDRDRFLLIQKELYRLCGTPLFDDVEVTLREVTLPPPAPAALRREAAAIAAQNSYLIIREEASNSTTIQFGCSVLTSGSKATVYKARQTVNKKLLDDHLALLGNDDVVTPKGLPAFGRKLTELVLPPTVIKALEREIGQSLVVVHDAAASRIPWETIQIGGKYPAMEGGLSHRYEAENLSIAKWLEQRQHSRSLEVLLVVDPTRDLAGAREEGRRVRELLQKLKPAVNLRELYQEAARKSEILKCLSSGKFDILHYAGHAYYDAQNSERSGIICSGNEVLSGAELTNIGTLPSLAFFNACEAGRIRKRSKITEIDDNVHTVERVRRGVSFAEAFLRGGVANYLGTYWPVGDAPALEFADIFYQKILAGEPLGNAIMAGRKAVEKIGSADWADYILYGDTQFVVKIP